MDKIYFGCDWIVIPFAPYDLLVETAKELNSELVLLPTSPTTPEGYHMIALGLNVASTDILDTFIEKAGKEARMTDWYPISKQQYEAGKPFFNVEGVWPPAVLRWLDGMNVFGRENERIKELFNSKSKK